MGGSRTDKVGGKGQVAVDALEIHGSGVIEDEEKSACNTGPCKSWLAGHVPHILVRDVV